MLSTQAAGSRDHLQEARQSGAAAADLHSPVFSVLDNIRSVYGRKLTQELIPFEVSLDETHGVDEGARKAKDAEEENIDGDASSKMVQTLVHSANWVERLSLFYSSITDLLTAPC